MEKKLGDTNIILRILVPDNSDLQDRAIELVNSNILIISEIIFSEIIYVLQSYYKYSRKDIYKGLQLLKIDRFEVENADLLFEALNIYKNSKESYADCYLIAKSKKLKISISTLDKKLKKLSETR